MASEQNRGPVVADLVSNVRLALQQGNTFFVVCRDGTVHAAHTPVILTKESVQFQAGAIAAQIPTTVIFSEIAAIKPWSTPPLRMSA